MIKKLLYLVLLCTLGAINAYCQDTAQAPPHDISQDTALIDKPVPRVYNLRRDYEDKRILWGIALGLHTEHFIVDATGNDSLKSVSSPSTLGFTFGINANLKLAPWLYLSFTPNADFVERDLYYSFAGITTHTDTFKLESTFINFPLAAQAHSPRFFNTDIYILGGGEYTFSTKGANLAHPNAYYSPFTYTFGLHRSSLSYEFGGGVSYYFPEFKLSLEARYCMGITNVLSKDGSAYTTPLNTLYNHALLFFIRLEGIKRTKDQ